jgi:hypothetical protein
MPELHQSSEARRLALHPSEVGDKCTITPKGPLRGTSVDALLPTVLEGLAITELPEFTATQYFLEKKLGPILTDWSLPEGGLYFVTPTARARPAKVSALAEFLITELSDTRWSAEAVMGWKPPARRSKRAALRGSLLASVRTRAGDGSQSGGCSDNRTT